MQVKIIVNTKLLIKNECLSYLKVKFYLVLHQYLFSGNELCESAGV